MAFTAFQTTAFQNDAFQTIFQGVPGAGDGFPTGGVFRRPIIYLDRDGKPVDIHAQKTKPVSEFVQPFELSPEIINALLAGLPVDMQAPVELAALEAKLGRLMIDRQLQAMADDDVMVALLLA
ncbi:hypothetical protein LJR234_004627 [Mesorhizobium amorphae]|uniref:hypothetical protein n=1 Tax=Mesorhizobium amorphae TaxID=71433 RepID=UPI003ECDA098